MMCDIRGCENEAIRLVVVAKRKSQNPNPTVSIVCDVHGDAHRSAYDPIKYEWTTRPLKRVLSI